MLNQEELSILPEGYHLAYVSAIDGIAQDKDGLWDYETLDVTDAKTGNHLFTIDSNSGAGDYRGYPANVYVMPALNDELYDAVVRYIKEDESDEDPSYGEVWGQWHDLDGAFEIQFILRRKSDSEIIHDSEKEGVYRYEFIGWLPTDDDFDLAEELENMDVPIERSFEVKVVFMVEAKNREDAEDKVDAALCGNELRWETDGIEEA